MAIELANGLNTLFRREHIVFLRIARHHYDEAVEESQRAPRYVVVPYGVGVETAGEDGNASVSIIIYHVFHYISFSGCGLSHIMTSKPLPFGLP